MQSKVLALLNARYKSLWRLLWSRGGVTPVIGLLIGLTLLAGLTVLCALAPFLWARGGGAAGQLRLAAVVIALLQGMTLLGAGLGGRLGIFNDPRPLLPYPVTGREWALAAVLGQAFDFGTGYCLAGLLGLSLGLLVAGTHGLVAAPLLLIGHLLVAMQIAGLSGVGARLSQSRRFRDGVQIAAVGFSVLTTLAYFWFWWGMPGRGRGDGTSAGFNWKALSSLTPSGALLNAQAAFIQGNGQRFAIALAALLLHAAIGLALIYLAVKLARRESGESGAVQARSRLLPLLLRPLPAGLAAFFAKDLAYLRREPGLAARLVGNLLNSLILIFFVAFTPNLIPVKGFYYFIMAMSSLGAGRMIFYNQWGYEGSGIRFLMVSGASSVQLLIAKWLLGFVVIGLDAGVKALVLAFFLNGTAGHWLLFGLILLLAPLSAAIGGYISLRQPWPMLGRGRLRGRSQVYDWAMLPISLLSRFAFLAAGAPVFLLWYLFTKTGLYQYAPLALLCGAGYALALASLALPYLAEMFDHRRPELLEALAIPEESI